MNTKNMLALKGAGGTGKTETLKLLIKRFEASDNFECKPQSGEADPVVVFVMKNIKVGISTGGDQDLTINRRVSKLIKLGCDIIISATRTEGKTVEAINKLAKEYHYSLEWIDKSRADKKNKAEQLKAEQLEKNQLDADNLFNRITEIINNH
ncbi:hypothetical protein KKJ25_06010 [Xenorhabdus bovienii]|uniref:hypothetical protein n=1 Tax=Xenorhabdus bovienii TaxID=40576 RepID=UPI00237C6EF4|nr:hypothetical protein [Xenorhabdus bovienii]MDE1492363.1 hypothetical protein [Xenorhabdus bovienii]MDE1494531.1 hypothetical protein [Xenorhabdus bovienii]MDE9472673.1 hypothetical protein [Xenorhabdus bovienii]MDE9533700.1 hypothetical protein [Xenorhabdus bovienii]